jgi:hypothetical protein
MIKYKIGIAVLLITWCGYSQSLIKIGPYCSVFYAQDQNLKNLYGEKNILYGIKFGLNIWNGFHLFLSGNQYHQVSETIPLGDISTLTLNPVFLSLRYAVPFKIIKPYAEISYVYMFYKESASMGDQEIGSTQDKKNGIGFGTGFELQLSQRFAIDFGVHFFETKVNTANQTINLGGLQVGTAFLVCF